MKNKCVAIFLLSLFLGVFIFLSPCSAVQDQEESYPTIPESEKYIPKEEKSDGSEINFSASMAGGYDTNIESEHYDPVASFFMQGNFGARGKYALSGFLAVRAECDITSIKYFRNSDPDLLDNVLRAGLDAGIAENLVLSLDYILDFVGFPHDEQSEYTTNEAEAALRHDVTDRLYQKIIYRFSHSHYSKWKTRNNNGTRFLGGRKDSRNTFEHQLGAYLTDKTFVKAVNTLYFNNSNELFLDYYDYGSLKTGGMIVHLITEKLYALANTAYQYKAYKNRVVSDQVHGDQRDHLLTGGVSLFYDITPAVSIGTGLDYRKNFSNEGAQRYTDYVISSGIYSRF